MQSRWGLVVVGRAAYARGRRRAARRRLPHGIRWALRSLLAETWLSARGPTCASSRTAVNSTMTTTSVTIVTDRTVCVNGPSARCSVTTAMAEEGERAMATTAANRLATPLIVSLTPSPRPRVGNCFSDARASPNTTTRALHVMASVRQRIVRACARRLSRASSPPAAKVITASVPWCNGSSCSTALCETAPTCAQRAPARR
jgi:hypothetical protein